MAFQPHTDPDYFLPSGRTVYPGNTFDAADLVETAPGSLLFRFQAGDYANPVQAPIPHVELTLFDLVPGTSTVTVYRIVGKRRMAVRGYLRRYAVGGLNVADWEAPFGQPIAYQAEQFDLDGYSLGFTRPFTTQLDSADSWLHNPLQPRGGIAVQDLRGSAQTVTRDSNLTLHYPQGSGLPIAIAGQRTGVVDAPIRFLTDSDAAADAVEAMLGDPYTSPSLPPVLCLRTAAGHNMRLPQPFYCVADQPVPTALNLHAGGHDVQWTFAATEVRPPALALVAPVLTRDDVDAAYGTRDAYDAAYGSRLEADRDYALVGAGGDDLDPEPGPGGGDTVSGPIAEFTWG